ncbi:MAG: hypothetical protein AAF549_05090 [Pseudomonadota bacterium]
MNWQLDVKVIFAAFVISSVLTVGCQAQIYMSSQHNGRVASMWRPISIFTAFILWIGLFPQTASYYMEDKLILGAIIFAFAINIFSFVLIRRNDIALRAFLLIAPIGVLYGSVAVLQKFVLPESNALPDALTLAFFMYLFMSFFSLGAVIAKKRLTKELISPRFIKAGLAIGSASAIAYIFILLSFSTVVNPGFTSVIGMLCPVWIMIYHKAIGIKDDASPWAGLLMILGASLLAYATM